MTRHRNWNTECWKEVSLFRNHLRILIVNYLSKRICTICTCTSNASIMNLTLKMGGFIWSWFLFIGKQFSDHQGDTCLSVDHVYQIVDKPKFVHPYIWQDKLCLPTYGYCSFAVIKRSMLFLQSKAHCIKIICREVNGIWCVVSPNLI